MKFQELQETPEYWMTNIQIELFQKMEEYMSDNNMNRKQLAEKLGVSKGYISQILNGDYDHRISKLVELSLAIGYYPTLLLEAKNEKAEVLDHDGLIENIISNVHHKLDNIGYCAMIFEKSKYKNVPIIEKKVIKKQVVA